MKIAERRAALGKGPGLSVLLPLGNAGRRRPAEVAAHDGDSRSRSTTSSVVAPHRRRSPKRWRWPTRSATRGSRSRAPAIRTRQKLPHWPAFNATDRPTMVFNNVEQGGERSDSRAAADDVRGDEAVGAEHCFTSLTGVRARCARNRVRADRSAAAGATWRGALFCQSA